MPKFEFDNPMAHDMFKHLDNRTLAETFSKANVEKAFMLMNKIGYPRWFLSGKQDVYALSALKAGPKYFGVIIEKTLCAAVSNILKLNRLITIEEIEENCKELYKNVREAIGEEKSKKILKELTPEEKQNAPKKDNPKYPFDNPMAMDIFKNIDNRTLAETFSKANVEKACRLMDEIGHPRWFLSGKQDVYALSALKAGPKYLGVVIEDAFCAAVTNILNLRYLIPIEEIEENWKAVYKNVRKTIGEEKSIKILGEKSLEEQKRELEEALKIDQDYWKS